MPTPDFHCGGGDESVEPENQNVKARKVQNERRNVDQRIGGDVVFDIRAIIRAACNCDVVAEDERKVVQKAEGSKGAKLNLFQRFDIERFEREERAEKKNDPYQFARFYPKVLSEEVGRDCQHDNRSDTH